MSNTYYIRARTFGTADFVVTADSEEDAINRVEWGEVDPEDTDICEFEDCEVTDVEYGETEIAVNVTIMVTGMGDSDELTSGALNRVEDVLAGEIAADHSNYVTKRVFRLKSYEVNEVNIES